MSKLFCLIAISVFFACQKHETTARSTSVVVDTFSKQLWNSKNGYDYPYREKLVEDLVKPENLAKFKQHSKSQIIEMLGAPNRIDSNYLFYTISDKRLGFFPVKTKSMVIKMRDTSAVQTVKIHE